MGHNSICKPFTVVPSRSFLQRVLQNKADKTEVTVRSGSPINKSVFFLLSSSIVLLCSKSGRPVHQASYLQCLTLFTFQTGCREASVFSVSDERDSLTVKARGRVHKAVTLLVVTQVI